MEALLSKRPEKYDGQDHKASWGRHFPLKGQGIFMFNLVRDTPFSIFISPENVVAPHATPGYIALKIGKDTAQFVLCKPDSEPTVLAETAEKNPGFVPKFITTYWYSFDHCNLVVKYGKGYAMEETTLLEHSFIPAGATDDRKETIRDEMGFVFSPKVKKVVMLYDVCPLHRLKKLYSALSLGKHRDIGAAFYKVGTTNKFQMIKKILHGLHEQTADDSNQGNIEVEKKVDFCNFPLVCNLPPFVIDSSKVTLFDIDSSKYMFSASLPAVCVELYSNVKNSDLNYAPTKEQYKLSDAIRYSLDTDGCVLNTKVKEKTAKDEFGSKKQVYLRVTLGPHGSKSPGFPYVLEIWPRGCGSPIHNHGNTYAVIHVLHGGLTISVYNKHMQTEPLKNISVKKGDFTWISPNWYQTHQLQNDTGDYCATIQCYQFGENDKVSWPYFDYLSTTSHIEEFFPDSDFAFLDMRNKVMEEYTTYMKSQSKT